ncbi:MAG: gliding motility-associated C-terminal domain-containing protein, partial [Bacteroidales bacterium]
SVTIWGDGGCGYLMSNDFNDGTPGPGWIATTGVDFTNPCGPGPDAMYMWMGWYTPIPRTLTTVPFSVSTDCEISFWLRFEVQHGYGGTTCEGPDLAGEGMSLQYSINGGTTWTDIAYFRPDGVICPSYPNSNGFVTVGSGVQTPFTQWAQYSFQVPPAAASTNTMFRFRQHSYSGQDFDHWGLDMVNIICPDSTSYAQVAGQDGFGPYTVYPTQTTTYYGTISDTLHGNSATDSITIVVIPQPSIDLGPDTSVCEGEIITLSPGAGYDEYLWSTGYTNAELMLDMSGVYSVTVANTYDDVSCFDSDTIKVVFVPNVNIDLGQDTCVTEPIILDATQPYLDISYLWSTGNINPAIEISNTGTYWVSAVNSIYNICGDSDTINVKVIPEPILSLPNQITICSHESFTLSASQSNNNLYEFIWSTGSTEPIYVLDKPQAGIYDISVKVIGCDTVYGSTNVIVENCEISIPNVITPNDDGINDVFYITNIEFYPNSEIKIYNRWGKKIYENENYQGDWDGKGLDDGTYYYIFRLNYGYGKIDEYHGTITIIK